MEILNSKDVLGKDVSFENLTRYDISIGCPREGCCHDGKSTSRRLKLDKVKGVGGSSAISQLGKSYI